MKQTLMVSSVSLLEEDLIAELPLNEINVNPAVQGHGCIVTLCLDCNSQ